MAGEDGEGGSLLAISDLHVGHRGNREVVEGLRPASPQDWLLVAGDVGDTVADVEWALGLLSRRFAKVVWAPGNHELWTPPADPVALRGAARYAYLVDACRRLGVLTPEDPYPVWRGWAARCWWRRCSCSTTTAGARTGSTPPRRRWKRRTGRGSCARTSSCCTPTRTRAGRRGAPPASPRPRVGSPNGNRGCRRCWSTTGRCCASRPGCCATRSSPSGAAPSPPPTGTCASTPPRWSTATCTFPVPPGTTGCASRRSRWATRGSGGPGPRPGAAADPARAPGVTTGPGAPGPVEVRPLRPPRRPATS